MARSYYLIDGYNLLHGMGALRKRVGPHGLERARAQLLDTLSAAFGADVGQVTVVFDASRAPPGVDPEQWHKGIRVLYALGAREADDVIEDLLAHHPTPKQAVVISDDHRLQQAARRRKGAFLKCVEFLDLLLSMRAPPKKQQGTPPPARDHTLTPDEVNDWLKEFGP